MIREGNKKGWVTCLHTRKMSAAQLATTDPANLRWATLDGKGIKYNFTYTLLDARVMTLANGFTDIIVLLRNPSGKDSRGEQWSGDWNPNCDLWTKHTKKQVSQAARMTTASTFWMSLGDVMDNFETITIGHTDGLFDKRVLNADMVEDTGSDWGVI